MLDANTQALNKYQEKLSKQETSYRLFLDANRDLISEIEEHYENISKMKKQYEGFSFEDDNDSYICDIEQMVENLEKISIDYDGYDFSEEVREMFPEISEIKG